MVSTNQIDLKFAGGVGDNAQQASRQAEKRQRQSFKKLFHLNTQRMLKILDYQPTTSDERKFLNSNYKQKLEKEMNGEMLQDNYYSTPDLNASSILNIGGGGPSLYDQHFMNDMHDKTLSMG